MLGNGDPGLGTDVMSAIQLTDTYAENVNYLYKRCDIFILKATLWDSEEVALMDLLHLPARGS